MDSIKVGEYIIIQRQKYMKIHKYNKAESCVVIGKDNVELNNIEGYPYNSTFKMISKSTKRQKLYTLELTKEATGLKDEIDIQVSGSDNRNIIDDGRSQKLSPAEIEALTGDSQKASDIVGKLISNSNTFHNKTEFSQEKYLRKKEKKYFEYIQIRKPNIRMISELMFKLDSSKIQGIRIDTLSQILNYANIQSEGNHLLYDSGSNGLLAAAVLNVIGEKTDGKLVHMHPGNTSQKQAYLAMNFKEEQHSRCISVNIYSGLRQFYQGCDLHNTTENINGNGVENNTTEDENTNKRKAENEPEFQSKIPKLDTNQQIASDDKNIENDNTDKKEERKKPKWHFDNIAAAEILSSKMDSLIIACKEDPTNIFNELRTFLKPGRPFVVYYPVAEPLQQLYMTLKIQSNIAALNVTCNWLRNYQVLPERTHPEVTMNNSSGFLLTGYVLK